MSNPEEVTHSDQFPPLDPIADDLAPDVAKRLSELLGVSPFTYAEMATILHRHGVDVSSSYLSHLRTGRRQNPTTRLIEGIAKALKVPLSSITSAATPEQWRDILTLASLQEEGRLLLQEIRGLSPDSVQTLRLLVQRLRHLEQLPPATVSINVSS